MQLPMDVILDWPICGHRVVSLIGIEKREDIHGETRDVYNLLLPNGDTANLLEKRFRPLEGHESLLENIQATKVAETKKKLSSRPSKGKKRCSCGCGGLTGGSFMPGHDMKAKSILNKAIKGEYPLAHIPTILIQHVFNNEKWSAKYGHLFP